MNRARTSVNYLHVKFGTRVRDGESEQEATQGLKPSLNLEAGVKECSNLRGCGTKSGMG